MSEAIEWWDETIQISSVPARFARLPPVAILLNTGP